MAKPVIVRHCPATVDQHSVKSHLLMSQAARPDQFHHTLVERRWERLVGLPILPPLSSAGDFAISLLLYCK
jgi:hypothetical protein